MLLQRVITAFILLFVLLGAVFLLPPGQFALFIALVIGIAIWEWSMLAMLKTGPGRAIYTAILIGLIALVTHAPVPPQGVLMAGAAFWLAALVLVCRYPAGKSIWANRPVLFAIGLPLFLPGWLALVHLREQQYYAFHVLFLFSLVAAADIGAYFAGRAFGKHKLSPRVSPNKTWEGFFGGLAACCSMMLIAAFAFVSKQYELGLQHWLKLLVAAILIAASSVVVDLFESMIKRYRDVKDSGTILPGHGGMLDRIDGITAAAPVYALLLMQMQQDFL